MSGRTLPVNISLGALNPETTYYYRLVAVGEDGTTLYGEEYNFDTLPVASAAGLWRRAKRPWDKFPRRGYLYGY